MTATRKTATAFAGRWRISEMELWDRDAMDLDGPAFIAFEAEAMGEFRFCAVQGWIDCRFGARDGLPLVEFSWEGADDADQAGGRGWAIIEQDGHLRGRIFIHRGDDSAFAAGREVGQAPPRGRRRSR